MSLKGIRKSDGTAEYIYADDTLSEENAPGEAKAAGDRIAGVEGRVTTLETAAPEIISNATKAWLDDNVTPTGSAVAIDSSLTQSGLAADAKAAGDAVNDLKSDLNSAIDCDLTDLISRTTFKKGSLNSSGAEIASGAAIRSDYIDVSKAHYIIADIQNGYKYAIFAYTEIGTFVDWSLGNYYKTISSSTTDSKNIILIPLIKYIRVVITDTAGSTSISVNDKNKLSLLVESKLYSDLQIADFINDGFYSWLSGNNMVVNLDVWDSGVPAAGLTLNTITNTTTRLLSKPFEIPSVDGSIELSAESGYKCAYYIYDNTWTKVKEQYWSTSYSVPVLSTYKYVIVCCAKTGDTTILPTEGVNVSFSFKPANNTNGHIQSIENITDNNTIDLGWVIGSMTSGTGAETSTTNRIRSKFVYVGKGSTLSLSDPVTYRHLIYKFDLTKNYVSDISWTPDDITVDEDCYIRILICKNGNGTITSDEVETIASKESIYRSFPQSSLDVKNEDNSIPGYYNNQLVAGIDSVRSNLLDCGVHGDGFVFITDLHWQSNAKNSPLLVEEIIKKTNINQIICGGDLIGGGSKASSIALMSDCVNAFKDISRFYAILGNHDTNKYNSSASDYFTKENAYSLMQKESDYIQEYGNPCYYYYDNLTTKTRYICLDTGEESTGLDVTQRTWLESVLNATPTGFHILVFAHIIYQATGTWHVGLQPSELEMTAFMTDVCNILDTFNTNHTSEAVEAIFGGHAHIDANFATTGGIPIVLTDCDTRQTLTETSSGSGVANHALMTVNEQCFDVTTIDYTNKIIKCVRIGRGNNRTITY